MSTRQRFIIIMFLTLCYLINTSYVVNAEGVSTKLSYAFMEAKKQDKPVFLIVFDTKQTNNFKLNLDTWKDLRPDITDSKNRNIEGRKAAKLVKSQFIYLEIGNNYPGITNCMPEYKDKFNGDNNLYGHVNVFSALIVTPDGKILFHDTLVFSVDDTKGINRYLDIWKGYKSTRDATNAANFVKSLKSSKESKDLSDIYK